MKKMKIAKPLPIIPKVAIPKGKAPVVKTPVIKKPKKLALKPPKAVKMKTLSDQHI